MLTDHLEIICDSSTFYILTHVYPARFAIGILPCFGMSNNLFICPGAVGCRASFPVLLHGCCRPGGGVRSGIGILDRVFSYCVSQDRDSY